MLTAVNSARRARVARFIPPVCCLLAVAGRARGDSPGPRAAPPHARPERIEFRAGRLDADPRRERLVLSEGVVIESGRYRLVSERLVLCRTVDGVELDGSGDLRFCPCESTPVSVGFSGARYRAGELVLSDPTLRVARLPILWLPELRLRARDRVGLLPPRLAWRGADGLLAGSGVHLPFARGDEGIEALDLRLSGYVRGGVEVDARVATARTSTALRWDHLQQSLVAIDAHGASSRAGVWNAAYRVDALRGPRALRASGALEEVARRYDQAQFSVGHASSRIQLAAGGWALANRGGAFEDIGAIGPYASLAVGDALGRDASAGASITVSTAADEDLGSETRAEQRASLEVFGAAGPVGLGLAVYDRAHAQVRQDATSAQSTGAEVGASLEAGVPLERDYGPAGDPLRHRVEPFSRAAFGSGFGETRDLAFIDGAWIALLSGLRTTLGRYATRQAGSLALQAGTLSGAGDSWRPVAVSRAVLDADDFGFSAEAAAFARTRVEGLAVLRARLGSDAALHFGGYLEGRSATESERLRLLFDDYWEAPRTGWFERAGWSAGSALHVPWTSWLASSAGADYDAAAEKLLGVRGAIAYQHPCGCLAVVGSGSQRLGRDGVDVAFTLDLMP